MPVLPFGDLDNLRNSIRLFPSDLLHKVTRPGLAGSGDRAIARDRVGESQDVIELHPFVLACVPVGQFVDKRVAGLGHGCAMGKTGAVCDDIADIALADNTNFPTVAVFGYDLGKYVVN